MDNKKEYLILIKQVGDLQVAILLNHFIAAQSNSIADSLHKLADVIDAQIEISKTIDNIDPAPKLYLNEAQKIIDGLNNEDKI